MNCRYCKSKVNNLFLDLGFAPPSNAYISKPDLKRPEINYPLRVFVCNNCWLVQTEDYVQADKFFNPDYAYFSSTSTSWLKHAKTYVEMIQTKLALNKNSLVIEIASNDGYLLRNFLHLGIPCLGIEPTISTAKEAKKLGINIIEEFFETGLAKKLVSDDKQADLIIGNNVYAHVPDIKDFTLGLKKILKKDGTITLEFAYILSLINENQFDTIYHEHFSYLSLTTVQTIFNKAGLKIYDVEELSTHGGSLRVYGCHSSDKRNVTKKVDKQLIKEREFGLLGLQIYSNFQLRTDKVKNDLLKFLINKKIEGKLVAAYGAAAKGNTLLNYAGVKKDLLPFVCDAAPSKQNKFLPGTHIPIYPPEYLKKRKPDFILILPWNISEEITSQLKYVRDWGGEFVKAIPELSII